MSAFALLALGWLKSLGGSLLKALADWRVLAVIAIAGLVVALVLSMRHGAASDAALVSEKTAYAQEHAAFLAEQAHSAALEAARGQDHASAVSDASDQERACSARVEAARRSATAITHILNEPPHANPDPAEPELLDAGELRSALGR